MPRTERSETHVRKCIIPINVSADIGMDGTYCTITPFVPSVSPNNTCYYAARYSHQEITSNFPSTNYGGGIGISGPCFPFRQRGPVICYSEWDQMRKRYRQYSCIPRAVEAVSTTRRSNDLCNLLLKKCKSVILHQTSNVARHRLSLAVHCCVARFMTLRNASETFYLSQRWATQKWSVLDSDVVGKSMSSRATRKKLSFCFYSV